MRGATRQVRSGVWRLRVVVGYRPDGQPRQASRTVYGTRRTAESELARFLVEAEGGHALVGSTSVGDDLERWMGHVRAHRQPDTARSYPVKCRRITGSLGRVRLDKLHAHHVDEAYRQWLAEGMAPVTVRAHHAVLSAAIMLAALTGCRRGELLGIRWSDVDRDEMALRVERAVKREEVGRRLRVGPTKTHQDRRVSLDPVAIAVRDTHRQRAQRWAADAGVTLVADGYVLTEDPTGATPMAPDTLTHRFSRLVAKLGADPTLSSGVP